MHDLTEPVCPECGLAISIEQLREAMRARPIPRRAERDPLWRQIRRLASLRLWVAECIACVVMMIAMDSFVDRHIGAVLIAAFAGLVCQGALLYACWWFGSISRDARLASGKPPRLEEGPIARFVGRVRGILGTCCTACLAIALVLGVIEWVGR